MNVVFLYQILLESEERADCAERNAEDCDHSPPRIERYPFGVRPFRLIRVSRPVWSGFSSLAVERRCCHFLRREERTRPVRRRRLTTEPIAAVKSACKQHRVQNEYQAGDNTPNSVRRSSLPDEPPSNREDRGFGWGDAVQ